MHTKDLKNKPLIEAIFELRWQLQEKEGGIIDPHYKILIGRIYDRVRDKYPHHEQLPTATMPDEIAGYVVQHRFRKQEDQWPLVQIGPGIMTFNDTEGYKWNEFKTALSRVLDALFDSYPDAQSELNVNRLLLRYIDAVDFSYERSNIFDFLAEKMRMNVRMDERLFEGTGVNRLPLGFDLRFSFPSTEPKAAVHLRFVRGKRENKDALVWETMVQSVGDDAPKVKDGIQGWVTDAHNLTDDWFFKMIQGDLLKRFE